MEEHSSELQCMCQSCQQFPLKLVMLVERREIRRDGGRHGGGGARARTGIAAGEGSGTSMAGWPLLSSVRALVGHPCLGASSRAPL